MNVVDWKTAMSRWPVKELYYYASSEDHWQFCNFEDQLTEAVEHYTPWPERGSLFLKAQQVLIEGAFDNGLEIVTQLAVLPKTHTAIIRARINHPTNRDLRSLHLKLTVDRDRPDRPYIGIYKRPPRNDQDPVGAIEKRFRYASLEVLNAKLADEFEQAPPLDFCTDFGPGD